MPVSQPSENVWKEDIIPPHIQEYVSMDNKRFENWIQELVNMRVSLIFQNSNYIQNLLEFCKKHF